MSKKNSNKSSSKSTTSTGAAVSKRKGADVVEVEIAIPVSAPVDDADDGDDDAAPAAVGPDGKKIKPTWMQDKTARLARNVKRARSFASLVLGNYVAAGLTDELAKEFAGDISTAAAAIEGTMTAFLAKLPAEFKGVAGPTASGAPRSASSTGTRKPMLAAGTSVRMKPAKFAEFSELLDATELASLSVVGTKGKIVILTTASGTRLMLPAKELEEVPTETAAAA